MRECVTWTPDETVPASADVLHLQGFRPGDEVSPRIRTMLAGAIARYVELAQPRAILADVPRQEFARIYAGEGRNASETPLDMIYPQATGLALIAATVGADVARVVRQMFDAEDMASGCMLDAVASAAADRLADLLAERYRQRQHHRVAVLPYSPGYCGWHVSGQRALFGWLRPEDVGITLNESCLMQPLKSVSGVLVAGPATIHKFHPTYPFCASCADKQCRGRMASVLRPQSQETLS